MNQKLFGATVTSLRKRHQMTQAELAGMIGVSDKTISKWETGAGYPEITLLPKLASVFGVSLDYLLTGERKGIAVLGNIVMDIVKSIDTYPQVGMLSCINAVSRAVGGCVPNVAIDLAKIDPSVPLCVAGCVGDDEYGRYMISQLQRSNIDTSAVRMTDAAPTSFTDVMSLPGGERTFFQMRGANALFSPEDVDIDALACSMMHIGYILLLDRFDEKDEEYGTVMARFLSRVQKAGIKTSIDVVSATTADYPSKIIPALKYCDYAIINEIECCSIWGMDPRREDGSLDLETLHEAMQKTMDCGVAEKVIVHSKEAGCCLDRSGAWTVVPSLRIPAQEIKGSVGAGDAFCAGCLYALYHHYADEQMLEFASAAAACNLFAENAVDGMRSRQDVVQLMEKYPRRELENKGE